MLWSTRRSRLHKSLVGYRNIHTVKRHGPILILGPFREIESDEMKIRFELNFRSLSYTVERWSTPQELISSEDKDLVGCLCETRKTR